ncbi:ferredoxin, partial [filamentous cyanobacterium CCP1]
EEVIQEAIDTCPVDCIHWVDYTELRKLEEERKYQVVQAIGLPVMPTASRRRRKPKERGNRGQEGSSS